MRGSDCCDTDPAAAAAAPSCDTEYVCTAVTFTRGFDGAGHAMPIGEKLLECSMQLYGSVMRMMGACPPRFRRTGGAASGTPLEETEDALEAAASSALCAEDAAAGETRGELGTRDGRVMVWVCVGVRGRVVLWAR
jgi:hypothetical protein